MLRTAASRFLIQQTTTTTTTANNTDGSNWGILILFGIIGLFFLFILISAPKNPNSGAEETSSEFSDLEYSEYAPNEIKDTLVPRVRDQLSDLDLQWQAERDALVCKIDHEPPLPVGKIKVTPDGNVLIDHRDGDDRPSNVVQDYSGPVPEGREIPIEKIKSGDIEAHTPVDIKRVADITAESFRKTYNYKQNQLEA